MRFARGAGQKIKMRDEKLNFPRRPAAERVGRQPEGIARCGLRSSQRREKSVSWIAPRQALQPFAKRAGIAIRPDVLPDGARSRKVESRSLHKLAQVDPKSVHKLVQRLSELVQCLAKGNLATFLQIANEPEQLEIGPSWLPERALGSAALSCKSQHGSTVVARSA